MLNSNFVFSLIAAFLIGLPSQSSAAAIAFDVPGWEHVSTAELKKFDSLWAVSDIHGSIGKIKRLFIKAGLVKNFDEPSWAVSSKNIVVVVGDSINKGSDSVGVLRFLLDIQAQARRAGSKIVILLGNHEAEFLAGEMDNDSKAALLENANEEQHRQWLEKGTQFGNRISLPELRDESQFGQNLRKFKVGAVVGSWMFAHSGYMSSEFDSLEFMKEVGRLQQAGSYSDLIGEVSDYSSLLIERDWTKKTNRKSEMHETLKTLGLTGILVGHDPGGLGARGAIAINSEGWLAKLDAGMNREAEDSKGKLLKCAVNKIVNAQGMQLLSRGKSTCMQIDPDEGPITIPIVKIP